MAASRSIRLLLRRRIGQRLCAIVTRILLRLLVLASILAKTSIDKAIAILRLLLLATNVHGLALFVAHFTIRSFMLLLLLNHLLVLTVVPFLYEWLPLILNDGSYIGKLLIIRKFIDNFCAILSLLLLHQLVLLLLNIVNFRCITLRLLFEIALRVRQFLLIVAELRRLIGVPSQHISDTILLIGYRVLPHLRRINLRPSTLLIRFIATVTAL